jgi:transposase InsO family protein
MKGLSVKDQRLLFAQSVRIEGLTIASACRNFEISRPTGYGILRKYDEFGSEGLEDLSRRPHRNSRAVSDLIANMIVDLKGVHPSWGPKKIRFKLAVSHPHLAWPVVSTVGRILDANGLVLKAQHRTKPPRLGELVTPDVPNRVWSADFKGQFALTSGTVCFPLTVSDNCSRYLLRCNGLPDTTGVRMLPIMIGAFKEFGLPEYLRIDNGNPFTAMSSTGLSRFQVYLIKLGIVPERIDPGAPQQNGRHERMHRTLKAEAMQSPARTMRTQQARFDAWRREYNDERPHEALGMATPHSIYQRSLRSFPDRLPAFEYDDAVSKFRVRMNGCVRWRTHDVFISETLGGEVIGIVDIDSRHSAIYAGFLAVAVIDNAKGRLLDGKSAAAYLKPLRPAKPIDLEEHVEV